jgi:opacity protein-like surface antigen
MALVPFIGRSFDNGFIYTGAGPTLSQTRTNLNNLVGFADINGKPTDVSGAPIDFTGSGWVYGGAAMIGATYFFDQSWFLDAGYTYAMTSKQTFDYSGTFTNSKNAPESLITGTLVGNSSGKVITQSVKFSINRAF